MAERIIKETVTFNEVVEIVCDYLSSEDFIPLGVGVGTILPDIRTRKNIIISEDELEVALKALLSQKRADFHFVRYSGDGGGGFEIKFSAVTGWNIITNGKPSGGITSFGQVTRHLPNPSKFTKSFVDFDGKVLQTNLYSGEIDIS